MRRHRVRRWKPVAPLWGADRPECRHDSPPSAARCIGTVEVQLAQRCLHQPHRPHLIAYMQTQHARQIGVRLTVQRHLVVAKLVERDEKPGARTTLPCSRTPGRARYRQPRLRGRRTPDGHPRSTTLRAPATPRVPGPRIGDTAAYHISRRAPPWRREPKNLDRIIGG